MGCLGIGLAALLALAIPASIAPASLIGAYVVIVLLALAGLGAYLARIRDRPATDRQARLKAVALRIAVLAALYAGVATVIHAVA